jgi:hypothetical protein
MNITTIAEFKDYILHYLGYPVNQVELEVDDSTGTHSQLDYVIFDSVQDFIRYNSEGTYLQYTTIVVSAGVSQYCLSGYNISDSYDLQLSYGLDGINIMFSPTHVLLYDTMIKKSGMLGGSGGGLVLVEWEIALEYLEQIKMSFGKMYRAQWHPGREVLEIIPTPTQNMVGMVALYIKEKAEYLYNHPLVKKLAVARAKILVGQHIRKYNVTMPDGITINGDAFVSEGREDEEKILERIYSESAPPDFFIG